MFDPKPYRDKAAEYFTRGQIANGTSEAYEFGQLERSFTTLADNEQWMFDNHQKTMPTPVGDVLGDELPGGVLAADMPNAGVAVAEAPSGDALLEREQYVLCCLGAALITQWAALPEPLQRELFDAAGSMGDGLETEDLRSSIAGILEKHKDGNTACRWPRDRAEA